MDRFRAAMLKKGSEAQIWYSRHLMWHYAQQVVEGIENLTQLDDDQYQRCLDKIQVYIRDIMQRRARSISVVQVCAK